MEFSEFELHDGFHVVCVGDKNCPLYCSEPYRAHDTEKEAAEVWNRRTALASGSGDQLSGNPGILKSGDHAELADLLDLQAVLRADRLPECSFDDGKTWELDGVGVAETFSRAADALETLLAENAALRAERDEWRSTVRFNERCWSEERVVMIDRATEAERALSEHRITADLLVSTLKADKVEAERRLAEAVGLLSELEQHVRAASDGRGHARAGVKSADAARTFLSGEAERG